MKTWTLILMIKANFDGGLAATNITGFMTKELCQQAFKELIVPVGSTGYKSGLCVEVFLK